MKLGTRTAILQACSDFLAVASNFYEVKTPDVRVLAARPLRIRETGSIELFGDYTFNTMMIRVWTRTAVRKQITSFGTFLSTLCHEFCHHLDCQRLGFRQSPHTHGDSTSGLRSCTTMREEHLRKGSCGCACRAIGGE